MKKIIYQLGTALALVGSLASCTLDSESITEKNTTNFPQNANDCQQALAGVYENLNKTCKNPQKSFFYISMLASDDNLGGGGSGDKLMQAEDLLCNYQQNMTEDFWKCRYEGINRANTLIDAMGQVALDEADKNQTEGEAKFLRGLYYYELASEYGSVPLITTTTGEVQYTPTAAEEWGQILQDFYDASELLPATPRNNGHADRYAAEGMLARAYLFYTGMYCNGEKLADLTSTTYNRLKSAKIAGGTDLTDAMVIAKLKDCIDNSGRSLVSDFRNLWAYTNKETVNDYSYTKGKGLKWVEDNNGVNPEALFAVKFNKLASWQTTIGYTNSYALHFGVRGGQDYGATFPFGQGWGAGPVAPNLVNDWKAAEPNDPRRDASIQDWTEVPTYTKGGWDFVQETDYFDKKQAPISAKYTGEGNVNGYTPCFENVMYGTDGWTNGSNNMQTNSIHDLVLLRIADVYLMYAELTEDATYMNKVRERVGLPDKPYSLENLQNERRWELAFEGVRWNDIRRWHIAAKELDKQLNQPIYISGKKGTNYAHNGGYSKRYNETAGFFKIPENQLSQMSKYLTQHDGWSTADAEYNGWGVNK